MSEDIFTSKLTQESINAMITLQSKVISSGVDIIKSSEELFKRAFQPPNFVYGLTKGNELLGFCNCSIPTAKSQKNLGIGIVPNNELDFVGHINTIIVDESIRGSGNGKKLIQAVLTEFLNSNVKYIFATISPTNHISTNLFQSFGFQKIGKYGMKDRFIFGVMSMDKLKNL